MSANLQQSDNGNSGDITSITAFSNPDNLRDKYTPSQVAWALRRNKGLILPTAKTLQCSSKTIYNLLKKYPELEAVKKEARTFITDFTELKLVESIKQREPWAVSLWLKTQGGYSEKNTLEHTGANGGPIQVEDVTDRKREVIAGMVRVQLECGSNVSEALKQVVAMGVPKDSLKLLRAGDLTLESNGNGVYGPGNLPEEHVSARGNGDART